MLGTLTVETVGPLHDRYRFDPGPDFEPYRSLFERAMELARRVTESIDAGDGLDYQADSLWVEAIGRIAGLGMTVGDPPTPVSEFALFDDWSVEIEFASPT
jgi:hypothetical protein